MPVLRLCSDGRFDAVQGNPCCGVRHSSSLQSWKLLQACSASAHVMRHRLRVACSDTDVEDGRGMWAWE